MLAATLLATLLGAPPVVVAGPDLADRSTVVEAPIGTVTVYSDRARIRRRATLSLGGGVHALRLPDLQGSVLLDTIRVSVKPGKLLRVESAPVMRERISIGQVDGWIEDLEKLSDEVALMDAESEAIAGSLQLVSEATPALPPTEAERQGRPSPGLLPELWKKAMDFLYDTRGKQRDRLREIGLKRRDKVLAIESLQRQIQRLDLGGFSDRKIQVLAIVELPGGKSELELEYYSTGASWKPAYDLRYASAAGTVAVETVGAVTQATGEDWTDVELELSTAIPGQSIALPKLLTWTLGEAKEFIPRPMPKVNRPQPPMFPLPQPIASRADAEREMKLARLSRRLAELQGLAQTSADQMVEDKKAKLKESGRVITLGDIAITGATMGEGGGAGGLAEGKSSIQLQKKTMDFAAQSIDGDLRRPAPVAAPRMEAYASAPGVAYEKADEEVSIASDSTRSVQSTGATRTSLALYEAPTPQRLTFADPDLPAMLAGGLDYVYQGQTRASIKSNAENVRVPLGRESYPVSTYYAATPGIDPTAFLEATVLNKSDRPILRGPLTIFVGDDFAGEGMMETTGPGGKIELPLGADEDIRVIRKVIPKTDTKGVFSKDDVTDYKVVIEVGNFKKRAIKVGIKEPLPKTTNEDIEIELVKATPKQSTGPDDENILRWELEIQPGKTRTIELEYKITRPANWQLYQR